MALALEIKAIEGLDAAVAALYKKSGDVYVLDVSGLPDVDGLKQKNADLLAEKAQWKIDKDAVEAKNKKDIEDAVEAALKKAKDTGDTAALEASWQTKFDSKVVEMQGTIDSLQGTVTDLTSGGEASRVAGEIGIEGSLEVLLPHIQKRLRTDMVGGKPKTVVLGTDGKASAMTVDELKAEFKDNKAFAPLIIGSKGKGGGHRQQGDPNPGDVDLSTLTPEAKLTYAREHPKT